MIDYKRCSEVSIEQIFNAFKEGFSDYIIKIEMPKEIFEKRFFGPEGNSRQHSFIAMDGEKAIGLILGGIKVFEGIKTIRCGTLCIHPEYRGKEISNKLFELYKVEGIKNGCNQLFLEVIVGNERAVKFYTKLGFEKVYDLKYFSLSDFSGLMKYIKGDVEIREISIYEFETLYNSAVGVHINWQNDLDYIKKSEDQIFLGAIKDGNIIGTICISKFGKISFLWIEPDFRMEGVAASLLEYAARNLEIKKVTASIPNNALLEGFYRRIGFKKDPLSQYEMYFTL